MFSKHEINKVISIIKELRNKPSTNEKKSILESNKDNELLKMVLEYTYNPFKKYGLSSKSIKESSVKAKYYIDIFELLEILSNSNINDSLRALVNSFLTFTSSQDEKDLYTCMILKDLKIGCNIKIINKVWNNLIPEFNIQQAYPINKYPLKPNTWFALEDKLNGINGSYLNDIILSRQGQEITHLDHIKNQLKQLSFQGYYFNGELIRKNTNGLTNGENFRETTSIVNSDLEDKTNIDFIIFDLIPIDEFYKGKSSLKYKERLEQLKKIKKEIIDKGLSNLDIPKIYYEGDDINVIDQYLNIAIEEDKEGLMCIKDCCWQNKRHNGILKIKKFMTADCEIIDYIEGEGRLRGTLGAFIIYYKGNKVNVGSGYTDEQRKEFWEHKDEYIGRILEVKYKEETNDRKTKSISLQFPVFVGIREDGKEISYN